eukprot:1086031-Rhodomonas_salina.1
MDLVPRDEQSSEFAVGGVGTAMEDMLSSPHICDNTASEEALGVTKPAEFRAKQGQRDTTQPELNTRLPLQQ